MYSVLNPPEPEETPYDTTEKASPIPAESVWGSEGASVDPDHPNGMEPSSGEGGSEGDQQERANRTDGSLGSINTDCSGNRDRVRVRVSPVTHGKTIGLLIDFAERSKQQSRAQIASLKALISAQEAQLEAQDELLVGLRDALLGWQAGIEQLKRESENYPQGEE